MIEVNRISRTFRSPVKSDGWKGALKLLARPQYQEHLALNNVSFTLQPGSFNGLIGANGAGKTTLLKILSGLIPPSSGEAHVMGHQPFKRTLEFRKQIALVMGQKAQLWWDLPAIDAFDLLRAIYEIPQKVYQDRLHGLTELLDVTPHLRTQIRRLSLGERMKMELIGAILHWPKVIFLDEPTIGLDIVAAHKLRSFLNTFNHREKATIILTSHNMDDIERLCSRVLILKSGQLIFDGKPDGLVNQEERRIRVRFLEKPSVSALASLTHLPESAIHLSNGLGNGQDNGSAQGDEESGSEDMFYITTRKEKIAPTLQALMSRHSIVDMGVEAQSLESVIQTILSEDRPS
jgi:ABC-2 type transport system ATP-binding protein